MILYVKCYANDLKTLLFGLFFMLKDSNIFIYIMDVHIEFKSLEFDENLKNFFH